MNGHLRGGRVDANNRIREMGCHEGYQTAMHTLDQYRGTIVAGSYCLPPAFSLPEALPIVKSSFHDAIARLVLAQPHLHVGITGENSKRPVFVRLDRIDLRKHVFWELLNDSQSFELSYLECMQTQLDSRYQNLSTQPGWRLVILHKDGAASFDALYVWNHPHHDGVSGRIFHQHLLRNLNEAFIKKQEPLPDYHFAEGSGRWMLNISDPSNRLPPNPELLTSWPMTPVFFVKALWKELKPAWIFPPGNTHAHWAPIRTSPFKTHFCNFTVSNHNLKRVILACRQHGTTLTGLIHALVLVFLVSALEDMHGFASRTPYDLRHILPTRTPKYPWLEPKESMCNYVSVVDHEFDADLVTRIRSAVQAQTTDTGLSTDLQGIVWPVSARVRREIQARLDSGIRNDMIGIMKLCPNWLSQQQNEARKTRYLSWLVTNLGILDGQTGAREGQEGWSLRRAELVLSAEIPSAAFSVSIITVKGGEACVTCSWQDCAIDASLGNGLMVDLERWLEAIGSQL